MKATASVMVSSSVPEVKLEHKGDALLFSISVFGRVSFQNIDVFEHINKYWADLPEERQDRIFKIYKEILFIFDNVWVKTDLTDALTSKVKELMDMHNLEDMQTWISFKSDIRIPENFTIDYEHSIDNNTSRAKTYIKSDYVKLVTLSMALRCMIPIWGEYVSNTRQDSGTQFKEYYAFQLMNTSEIMHSPAIDKLKTFVEATVGDDKNDPNITLKGISSEDFGYWLLSLVCIRRLCVGDIRGIDPNVDICKFIYKFIIQKLRNSDNNFENVVKEKTFDDRGPDGENKISSLERYKIKTNISLGEIVELEYSIRNIVDVAHKLTSKLDPYLLERSLHTSQALMNQRLLDPQMTLLRWVFKPVISPKGLMYISKPLIVQAIGAMEAVLWARGHKYLALLCSAHPITSENEMVVSPVPSNKRVPPELLEELDKLYPFKAVTSSKKAGSKEHNLATRSIDIVRENLVMFSWRPTAHESMLHEVLGNMNRKVPIKPDIVTDLTRLVIELGNRSWL